MAQERRQFKKLRISLTDTCNMACTYCVPENQALDIRSQLFPPLSVVQLTQIVAALHKELNLQKIRLTGGEPLLYPNVVHLVKELKQLGIDDIALTTNAFYLGKLAKRLKEAGLKSVNISLDALDEEAFIKMTRKNMLKETLHGIDKALEHGLKVKINSVILKGINDHQIIPLLDFGIQKNVPIRFMELMKMGYLHHQYNQYFYPQSWKPLKSSFPLPERFVSNLPPPIIGSWIITNMCLVLLPTRQSLSVLTVTGSGWIVMERFTVA